MTAPIEISKPQLDHRSRVRAIVLLGIAIFCLSVGISLHVSMNVNYLHEMLAASSWEQGYLESIREFCGILSFFMIVLLAGKSEPRVAAAVFVIVGIGLAAYYGIETISQVIAFSLLWSFGAHIWFPLASSMQLGLAPKGREGRTLGMFGSVGISGVLVALGAVYVLKNYAGFGMRNIFLIAGGVVLLAAIPLLAMPDIRVRRARTIPLMDFISGPYRLFCGIELLDGMRRQVFLLFAVLVLVREYGVEFDTIALLMFINHVMCIGLAPAAGWLTDRVGERPVLSAYFIGIAAVFILYTLTTDLMTLFVIYIVDNVMFVLRVGVATYANRIARKGERTQLLAMGVTMNHVGAVTLPLVGGALYATLGYRFPFYCGAVIAVFSLALVQFIPPRWGGEVKGATDLPADY